MANGTLPTTSAPLAFLESVHPGPTLALISSTVATPVVRCIACSGVSLKVFFAVLFSLIVIVGVSGNSFVISVIVNDRKLLHSSINLFLLNLAVADLGNLLFCTPDIVQVLVDQGWILPAIFCPIIRFLQEYFLYASVLMQMSIGIERFMAICNPLRMQRFSRQTSVYVLLFVWGIACGFAQPYLLFQRILHRDTLSFCFWTGISGKTKLMFKYAECTILYFVPLVLLTVLYTVMGRVLWGTKRANIANESQQMHVLQLRRSVVKMLIISMLLYFVCYSPIQGIFIVETILHHRVHISQGLRLTLNALSFSSSAANPIVYICCCRHFRKRFLSLIRPVLVLLCPDEKDSRYAVINPNDNVAKVLGRHQFVSFRKVSSKDFGTPQSKLSFGKGVIHLRGMVKKTWELPVLIVRTLLASTVLCALLLFSQSFAVSHGIHTSDIGGFVTMEKKASLSGIRIESEEPGDEGFHGYTDKGVSIVHPDTTLRVVLFGWWLDEVMQVAFTLSNCNSTYLNVSQADFMIQTEKRVVIKAEFAETSKLYKICLKQKPRETTTGELVESHFSLIDDFRTSISTDLPPRKYYLPFGVQISIISFLLVLSGLFSGLNLGLMALTPQELMLIQKSGSKQERKYADIILPVRRSGNFLLCSLLIGNVCVNSAISILLDDLTSGYVALIVSSAGIVIFGEIFPQSICVKKGLAVGARTIWITRFFMVLTFPLAYPISRALDAILGDEVVSYDRKRLMELIKMSTRNEEGLAEELKIAVGAMEISDKTVSDVMTRIDDVFMLPDTTVLNTKTVAEILRMGYTRIPVYSGDRNTVVSLLFVKDLALLDPDDNFTIKTVCGYHEHPLRFIMEDTPLRVMLEEFKKGDYHLAMVQRVAQVGEGDPVYELTGIVTLEDIVEEILQAEIVDETDVVTDNVHRIRRRGAQARDLTYCMMDNDTASQVISMQMQLVTLQWLTTNHRAFHSDFISQNILEKIIRQNVRRVEFSHLPDMNDPKAVIPKTAKLYTKQEPSEKFVLILEGRAMITIGQNMMTFEAGPWHCFGEELLNRLVEVASGSQGAQNNPQPQQQPARTTVNPSPAAPSATTGAGLPSAFVESRRITFVPDFSAVVRDDCTYLEITAQTYLLAYKSTLLSRGNRAVPLLPNEEALLRGTVALNSSDTVSPPDERCPLISTDVETGLTQTAEVLPF
ncbi:hypothetical protein QR680_017517 [Steinernema hermaphroditum]|uniref:G-protein coupled receptors family 1 profile domain-containing protein n=1 Tax=Steinernema hermaphroditum TaxID=289476 RepID=A0AA39HEV9_9BILA|nr:hypothetical protein QR680_017517 [Steinernema hermaphroditum]